MAKISNSCGPDAEAFVLNFLRVIGRKNNDKIEVKSLYYIRNINRVELCRAHVDYREIFKKDFSVWSFTGMIESHSDIRLPRRFPGLQDGRSGYSMSWSTVAFCEESRRSFPSAIFVFPILLPARKCVWKILVARRWVWSWIGKKQLKQIGSLSSVARSRFLSTIQLYMPIIFRGIRVRGAHLIAAPPETLELTPLGPSSIGRALTDPPCVITPWAREREIKTRGEESRMSKKSENVAGRDPRVLSRLAKLLNREWLFVASINLDGAKARMG